MLEKYKENEHMTSKERVLTAFSREKPDRVPVNFFSNKTLLNKLKNHFNIKSKQNIELLEILGVDFRGVGAPYTGKRLHKEIPGITVDPQWGMRRKWIENKFGGYWDYCEFPLADADEETIMNWPLPSPDDYDYSKIHEICKKNSYYAISTGGPGAVDIINKQGMLRGMEQALIDIATNDPAGMLLIDRRLEVQLAIFERILSAAKGGIDFLWIGDDLGTQRGPIMSLELYRKQIKPRHKKFIDLAKTYNIPVMIHSCGSSSFAFDDFIELGISIVDTLQPEAKNMEPNYLKKTYGEKLAFHGCISTAGPVAYGNTKEVEKNVQAILKTMMPGGGFSLAPTHLLQDNTPVENVIEMYKSAFKYGFY